GARRQDQELWREVRSTGDARGAAPRERREEYADVFGARFSHEIGDEVPHRVVLSLHRRRPAGADPVQRERADRTNHARHLRADWIAVDPRDVASGRGPVSGPLTSEFYGIR